MKKQIFLALACLSAAIQSLSADCCYTDCCSDCFGFDSVLTFDIGGGYRNDTLKWKVFPSEFPGREIEEKWKNIGMGIVDANAQFLVCEHYLLKAEFDYGWFSNNGSQRYLANGGDQPNINYRSSPRGNACDLSGGLGYQFNMDCFRVSFAPLVGYSYHQQRLKSRTYRNLLVPDAEVILAHNDYKFRWSGPWVGFALSYQATCELQLYFDYYYHWARFRGTVKEHFVLGEFPSHLRSNRAYGNEFTLGGIYTFCDYWYIGIKYDCKLFCGNKGKSNVETINEDSPLRKLNWQSQMITLNVGYTF